MRNTAVNSFPNSGSRFHVPGSLFSVHPSPFPVLRFSLPISRHPFLPLVTSDFRLLNKSTTTWYYVNSRRNVDSEKSEFHMGFEDNLTCSPHQITEGRGFKSHLQLGFRVYVSTRIYVISCCCCFSIVYSLRRLIERILKCLNVTAWCCYWVPMWCLDVRCDAVSDFIWAKYVTV